MVETFRQLIRKRILEMKTDAPNFYTETYNLVSVILKLSPDPDLEMIRDSMIVLYRKPSEETDMSLPQLESLHRRFKDDFNLKIRGLNFDIYKIKGILDKVRRSLLFYFAIIEDKPKNYDIILEKQTKTSGEV